METNDEFWQRRRQQERELERKLDRAMIPIMLPMVVAAGAMAGLVGAMLLLPPLPRDFIGVFMMICMAVGVAPLIVAAIVYR